MTLDQLTEQGFASYSELKATNGIKKVIEKGKNDFGFNEREIIDVNGNTWDYIPEDNTYELKLF